MLKRVEVSRFVIGGADLMFPGISVPAEVLPSFLSGEPWAVKVPGSLAPIAISLFGITFTTHCRQNLWTEWIRTLFRIVKHKMLLMQVGFTTMTRAEALKAELHGKTLRIAHYYRDLLWESVEGYYVPNAGFKTYLNFQKMETLEPQSPHTSIEL